MGRGLRLMPNTEGRQTLEVMGTRAFEAFVQELEKEGLGVPVTKKPPVLPVKVEPIRERSAYDIAIPLTQPLFGHTYRRLSELDPATIGLLRDLPDVTGATPELRFVLEFMTTQSQVGELKLGYPMLLAEDAVGRLVDSAMDKAQLSGASKHGVVGLTRSAALEVADRGADGAGHLWSLGLSGDSPVTDSVTLPWSAYSLSTWRRSDIT